MVARLAVHPEARRAGVASALLATATSVAVERGRIPVLDVATHFEPALRLYEASGWTRIATVVVVVDGEAPLTEHVYAARPAAT